MAGRHGLLCWVVMFCLSACAGPTGQEHITWQCARTLEGDRWACAQQRVRDGVLVGPVAPPVTGSGVEESSASDDNAPPPPPAGESASSQRKPRQTVALSVAAQPREAWTQRLPGLQEAQPVVEAVPVVLPPLQLENAAGPPPEPEPVLARWADADRASLASVVKPAPAAQLPEPHPEASKIDSPSSNRVPAPLPRRVPAAPGEHLTDGASPEAPTHSAESPGRYTVQIGAFRSEVDARTYLAEHQLDTLPVVLSRRRSGGRDYRVLTFGQFATVRQAVAAWQRVAAGRNLDFWVRPLE